ncbi:phosphoribosylformylglycinamidine synthase, partial [mine drainage metagenome]
MRDESATGRGARPRAGLCGFTVSNLRIPGYERSWETPGVPHSPALASPLTIMLEGPSRGGLLQQRVRTPEPPGVLPEFRMDA